jgi:hypothetical protein
MLRSATWCKSTSFIQGTLFLRRPTVSVTSKPAIPDGRIFTDADGLRTDDSGGQKVRLPE